MVFGPIPMGPASSDYSESGKLFPGVQDYSSGRPHPTSSKNARSLKRRVACITIRIRGSLLCSLLLSSSMLMIMGNDSMLAAQSKSAVTLHIDGISYFAFLGQVDRLYDSHKPITR
jgi:hypothetical protein